MSYLLDVYYDLPADADRETRISEIAVRHGGKLHWKGTPPTFTGPDYSTDIGGTSIWLQFEFEDHDAATIAQKELLRKGEWAEPPSDIGD